MDLNNVQELKSELRKGLFFKFLFFNFRAIGLFLLFILS